VHDRLREVGFAAPIMEELRIVADDLEQAAASAPVQRGPTWR
jgi:hypothetical protein